ncbi:uncharacterized protein [Atheta coriaria]|uniref:uncharacterized protein n=1 Tax=Dalotia coriaria TaxID=877792 RepID=UPI0031F379A4
MACKAIPLILIIALLYIKGGQSWSQDPWFGAYQSLKFERQHISLAITNINRQISSEISGRITAITWTLNQIKNQAQYAPTACAQRTLADIETFFSTMHMIHECRNNALINVLREKQMQQIDELFGKVKEAETTCRTVVHYQECADNVTKEIQARLLEIRDETQGEAQRITQENSACVEQRGSEMIGKVNEIETNWKTC